MADETKSPTRIAIAAILGAVVFGLAVIAAVVFIWHPGGELPTPNARVSQVPAPAVPVTPDVTHNTSPPPLSPDQAPIQPEEPSGAGPSKPVLR